MVRYGMLVEVDRCVGCDICLKACKDEYVGNDYPPYSASQPNTTYGYGLNHSFGGPDAPTTSEPWVSSGHLWMKVEERVWGTYPTIRVRYVPLPCMHCDDPPCRQAADSDAVVVRPDGVVIIDPEKSYDQEHLVAACPYHRIYYNAVKRIPQKCTFCVHLLEVGGQPRCVEACPLQVLTFGDLDDPTSEVAQKIQALNAQPLSPDYQTRPKVYYSGFPRKAEACSH